MIFLSSIYKTYLFVLFVVSCFVSMALPSYIEFSKTIFYIQFCLCVMAIIAFFVLKKKENYFDVDVIFVLFLTIPHFVIPFYANTPELSDLFFRGYNSSFFIKGVAIALTGILWYMIGSLTVDKTNKKVKQVDDKAHYLYINDRTIFALVILCIFVFYLFGGYDYYRNQYMEGVGIDAGNSRIFQATSLLTVLCNIYCALIFVGKKTGTIMLYISMLLIFLFAISVAIVGCRTLFAGIVLPYLMCFTHYKKPLNLFKTVIGLLIGVMLMYVLQITRQGGNSFNAGFFYLFSDMIIPGNVFFESVGYVEKNGLNYGLSMMPPLIGCIPGLSSFLGSWTTEGSAEIMTKYLSGAGDVVGLGTTIFADIYLSFGVIGVPLFMYLLGYYANKKWRNSFYGLVINTAFFSSCLFMCRAGYFLPMRLILWGLLFSKICNIKIKKY